MHVNDLIIEFADAKTHANEGVHGGQPAVLDNRGQRCTPQMARLHNAHDAILALDGQPDLPQPVVAMIAAEQDRGCAHCWLSSKRIRNHPECNDKIQRYFAAYVGLADYGRSLQRQFPQTNPQSADRPSHDPPHDVDHC